MPDARANLAPIPEGLADEEVLMRPDILSTGLSGAESAGIRVGDSVAVFAQGPIGLCATLGAKLRGAALIIAVDPSEKRLEMARRFGADVTLSPEHVDPVEAANVMMATVSTWPSKRWASRKPSRARFVRSVRGARFPASV